jgi:hypothetical protein
VHFFTLAAFAAPASFFSVAANSHAADASLSHFFMKEVFAAPPSFFSAAAAVHDDADAGAAGACAKEGAAMNAAKMNAMDLII